MDGIGDLRAGDVLAGRYRLERPLGAGAMGFVLRAHHLGLDRPVALKLLHPKLSSSAAVVRRFLREARAAARIQGDHVARVFDVARLDNGVPYIVFEYLEGEDLAALLRRHRPLAVTTALHLALQVARALAAAHDAGVIHRDIKPANILLEHVEGALRARVIDFGISKIAFEDAGFTETDAMLGSPMYMSPEQLRAVREIDARTDVWSLGCVLYEMLTGTPAYQASTTPRLILKIATESPAPLLERRPDAGEAVAALVHRCLAKSPSERFADGRALVTEIGRLLEELRDRQWAARHYAHAPPSRWTRPRRILWNTTLVVAASMTGVLLTYWWVGS